MTGKQSKNPDCLTSGFLLVQITYMSHSIECFMSLRMSGQTIAVSPGRSKQEIFFSLLRKAIINVPLTVILPIWMGTSGVFEAEAVSQLLGGLVSFITMYFAVYRLLGRLRDGAPLLK